MNSRLRFNRHPEGDADGPRMIAVASGKGGVGKSVIAFNLAERLADAFWPLLGYHRWLRRHRTWTTAAAVVALFVVDGGIKAVIVAGKRR